MSNAEKMVMVPRDLADKVIERLERVESGFPGSVPFLGELRETLAQPVQQHQGDPVTLPAEKELVRAWGHDMGGNYEEGKAFGWNAFRDEIAKLGPLYTHSAPVRGEPVQAFKNCIDARAFIADLFKQRLRRRDFDQYIAERLAGDFAFALANWLVAGGNADPAEVERLRETLELVREQRDNELRTNSSLERERDTLRAQLAEAQALLRMFAENSDDKDVVELSMNVLSASAEPEVKS